MMLGLVSAAGSLGTLVVPLATQALLAHEPWQIGALFFVLMAIAMLPAAFWAGGADRFPGHSTATTSMREVLGQAMRNRPFLVMSGAYFVCGLNLVFLTTHLPAYLAICGQDPMLGAEALAVIGGVSAIGSLLTGWLGGKYPKHILLGLLYILRSVMIAAYFVLPPTPTSTLLFAAAMGMLWWPGLVPLIGGLVAEIFGTRYMATLLGLSFVVHQAGCVAWSLGRRVDLRPLRLLRPRVADRHADRIRRRCRPDPGRRSNPAARSYDRARGRDDVIPDFWARSCLWSLRFGFPGDRTIRSWTKSGFSERQRRPRLDRTRRHRHHRATLVACAVGALSEWRHVRPPEIRAERACNRPVEKTNLPSRTVVGLGGGERTCRTHCR